MRTVKVKNGIMLAQSFGAYMVQDMSENGGKPELFPTFAKAFRTFQEWVRVKKEIAEDQE